jgi:hypothetical protein
MGFRNQKAHTTPSKPENRGFHLQNPFFNKVVTKLTKNSGNKLEQAEIWANSTISGEILLELNYLKQLAFDSTGILVVQSPELNSLYPVYVTS